MSVESATTSLENTPKISNNVQLRESIRALFAGARDKFDQTKETTKTRLELSRVRERCRELEQQLGIDTIEQRLFEASLFIDFSLLQVSVLRGDEHPEELFGAHEWENWLKARVLLRQYTSLTRELIDQLYDVFLNRPSDEDLKVILRRQGGDYTNTAKSILLSKKAQEALVANPYTLVEETSADEEITEEGAVWGKIIYPSARHEESLAQIKQRLTPLGLKQIEYGVDQHKLGRILIDDVVEWFSQALKDPQTDPVKLAALLQRDIVSIHYKADKNGTVSRLLLQWVLELCGERNAVLEHPEEDLFFLESEWIEEVRKGQEIAAFQQKAVAESRNGPAWQLFFIPQVQAFYEQLFQHTEPPPKRTKLMAHAEYDAYLEKLSDAYTQFAGLTERSYDERVKSGGFITDEFISNWGDTRPSVQEQRKGFYDEKPLFRGGVAEGIEGPESVARFFDTCLGFNTGYWQLMQEGISPMSVTPVDTSKTKEQLRAYNEILEYDFISLTQEGSDRPVPKPRAKKLMRRLQRFTADHLGEIEQKRFDVRRDAGRMMEHLLACHNGGQEEEMFVSPFVSTSEKPSVSAYFMERVTQMMDSPRYKGVILITATPKQGVYYMPTLTKIPLFSDFNGFEDSSLEPILQKEIVKNEYEITVAGGIEPGAVETVFIFDHKGKTIEYCANRTTTNEIIVHDLRNKKTICYAYSQEGVLIQQSSDELHDDEIDAVIDDFKKNYQRL